MTAARLAQLRGNGQSPAGQQQQQQQQQEPHSHETVFSSAYHSPLSASSSASSNSNSLPRARARARLPSRLGDNHGDGFELDALQAYGVSRAAQYGVQSSVEFK